jgi:glyoxylase-like metal-dependent hydrolase (beta-lactamase superfamily II)
MQISAITVGAFEVNCWVLMTPQRKAVVIDPGADAAHIDNYLAKHGLEVCGYLVTHGHMDHISALAALCERHRAPIHMHPDDAKWAFTEGNQMQPYYDVPTAPPADLLHPDLTEIRRRTLFDIDFQILETPGHSPGSVCIYVPEITAMFTGDTLFAGSVGRTDFPGGNANQLQNSLRHMKETVPVDTELHPGHGNTTTLAKEIKSNPFMQ